MAVCLPEEKRSGQALHCWSNSSSRNNAPNLIAWNCSNILRGWELLVTLLYSSMMPVGIPQPSVAPFRKASPHPRPLQHSARHVLRDTRCAVSYARQRLPRVSELHGCFEGFVTGV